MVRLLRGRGRTRIARSKHALCTFLFVCLFFCITCFPRFLTAAIASVCFVFFVACSCLFEPICAHTLSEEKQNLPPFVAIGRLIALPVVPPVSLHIVTFAVPPPSPHMYSTVWCRCGRGWSRSWEKRQARGLRFCT